MEKLVYEAFKSPNEVARVLTGSRGYGYPHELSDYDIRAVFVLPTKEFLKVNPVREKNLNLEHKFCQLTNGVEIDIMGLM